MRPELTFRGLDASTYISIIICIWNQCFDYLVWFHSLACPMLPSAMFSSIWHFFSSVFKSIHSAQFSQTLIPRTDKQTVVRSHSTSKLTIAIFWNKINKLSEGSCHFFFNLKICIPRAFFPKFAFVEFFSLSFFSPGIFFSVATSRSWTSLLTEHPPSLLLCPWLPLFKSHHWSF